MNLGIVKKYGLFSTLLSHTDERLTTRIFFDTWKEADNAAGMYTHVSVKPVMCISGNVEAGLAASTPVEVKVTKYQDMNGKIWDEKMCADRSNACIIVNNAAGTEIVKYSPDGGYDVEWKTADTVFEITEEKVIDALEILFSFEIDNEIKRNDLLYRDLGDVLWQPVEKQINEPRMTNKLINMKKELARSGKLTVRVIKHWVTDDYGDRFSDLKLLVKTGTALSYRKRDDADMSCKTCRYRGFECGYSVSKDNLLPRCYEQAEVTDVKARPEIYADSYEKVNKDLYGEFDKGDFSENFENGYDPDECD